MERIFIFIVLLSSFMFGNVETRVLSVYKNIVNIENTEGIKASQSAFVSRVFDDSHETIIAECIIGKDTTKMECKEFDFLYQESLSLVKDWVKEGDKVYVGLLEKSASIIAPDQKSYMAAKEALGEYMLFHPDLLAINLYDEGNPAPKREEFKKFCMENFIGTLFFALSDGLYEVDCSGFALLSKIEGKYDDKESGRPFYNRVGEIERGVFDFASEEVVDFTAYYKKLIGAE